MSKADLNRRQQGSSGGTLGDGGKHLANAMRQLRVQPASVKGAPRLLQGDELDGVDLDLNAVLRERSTNWAPSVEAPENSDESDTRPAASYAPPRRMGWCRGRSGSDGDIHRLCKGCQRASIGT